MRRYRIPLAVPLLLLAAIAYGLSHAPAWFWHPLGVCTGTAAEIVRCKSYNLYSGAGSDLSEITLPATVLATAITVYHLAHRHFECHEETCARLGLHPVHDQAGRPTGHRTCWEHHPVLSTHPRHGVPLHVIHARHKESQ